MTTQAASDRCEERPRETLTERDGPAHDTHDTHDTRLTLESRLATGVSMPVPEILAILQQVAGELDRIAATGVYYGGVSPSAIALDVDGSARLVAPDRIAALRPAYHAPEQRHGEAQDASIDQYALALVAYEMLSGLRREQPDERGGAPTIHEVALRPEHPLRPGLSPAANEPLRRALGRTPTLRFESVTAFVTALGDSLTAAPAREIAPLPSVVDARARMITEDAANWRSINGPPRRDFFWSTAAYGTALVAMIGFTWVIRQHAAGVWVYLWKERPAGSTVVVETAASVVGDHRMAPVRRGDAGASAAPGGVAPGAPARRVAGGFVLVEASAGAPMVYVDGRPMGRAPLVLGAALGIREVAVREEGRRYLPAARPVLVTLGDTASVTFVSP